MDRVTRRSLGDAGQIYFFRGIMINGCDVLEVSRHTSIFCHKVGEATGGIVERRTQG